MFVELMEYTGLDTLLKDDEYYSVFVPDNEAFEMRYSTEQWDSLKVDDVQLIKDILLHHIVADTMVIDFGNDYLPLSGSHITIFIDAAGNIIVSSLGNLSSSESCYIVGLPNASDLYTDYPNGRLYFAHRNVLHPNCAGYEVWYNLGLGTLVDVIIQAKWIDTIEQFTLPYTFLGISNSSVFDYIEENGGFDNVTFVDSLIRRHIINGYLPWQEVTDGLIAKNLLDEDVRFSINDGEYFVGDSVKMRSFYDYKKCATFRIDSFLVAPIVSSLQSPTIGQLKIFPNPATNTIRIETTDDTQPMLKIYSLTGVCVREKDLSQSVNRIDIGDLADGYYILEYFNDATMSRTILIKQKQ